MSKRTPPRKKDNERHDDAECPYCGELIKAEAVRCRFCGAGVSKEHFRSCPICGELVRKEAILCRFCKASIASLKEKNEPWRSQTIELSFEVPDAVRRNEPAAGIVDSIICNLHGNYEPSLLLQNSIEHLASELDVDRAVVWMITGDNLEAIYEFCADGKNVFKGTVLNPVDSGAFVLEILSRYDHHATRTVSIEESEPFSAESVPSISSLVHSAGIRSRLVTPMRVNGAVSGFVEVQRAIDGTGWSPEEKHALGQVATLISVVIQHIRDKGHLERV